MLIDTRIWKMHFVKEKLWYTQVDFYKFHRRTSREIISPNSESITAWQNCHEYSYSKYIPSLYHFPIIIIIHYEQHSESWPSVASDRLNCFLAVGSALLPEWSFQKQNWMFFFSDFQDALCCMSFLVKRLGALPFIATNS